MSYLPTHAPWLLAITLALAIPAATADTIRIGGTGAGLGTMRVLGTAFAKVEPAHTIIVVPSLGTTGGIKALAVGAIDLAVTARPLNAQESSQGMVAVEYGRTPFVVATNMWGTGTLTTLAELAEIYAGRKTDWADGRPIRLVIRPEKDSDTQLLGSYSPEIKRALPAALARPGMIVATSDQDAADFIEKTAGAIGTTTLAQVRSEKRNLDVLPLNGVEPSVRTLDDGSYPYAKAMYLVGKGAGTPAVAAFLQFVASPRGRQILGETGHSVARTTASR